MVKIKSDCRHFRGDRPCSFHKTTGVHCEVCKHYEPIRFRLLIIKLDAMGDVLRTTCILRGLKLKHENSTITWLTRKESTPLFINNPYVDEVLAYNSTDILKLHAIEYDLIINLDASPESAVLASVARGKKKLGFAMSEKNFVYPLNSEANDWFEMGLFDDIKKKNKKSYQQIALEICRLPVSSNRELILNLSEKERQFSKDFSRKHQLQNFKPIIGINAGAGERWQYKKWTFNGFLQLAKLLKKNIPSCGILLYGGPEEAELNARFKEQFPAFINTGCNNSIRDFAALMDLCDLLVTGDTLAMHIAIALKKQVVVLFGPTSSSEIDLYDRGSKVTSSLPCTCCYRSLCDKKPNCMETINPENVYTAIMSCLKTM